MRYRKPGLLTICLLAAACGPKQSPATASDYCGAAQRITAEPAPAAGADDPGNRFDTDETFLQVLEHNRVHDRLCGGTRR